MFPRECGCSVAVAGLRGATIPLAIFTTKSPMFPLRDQWIADGIVLHDPANRLVVNLGTGTVLMVWAPPFPLREQLDAQVFDHLGVGDTKFFFAP